MKVAGRYPCLYEWFSQYMDEYKNEMHKKSEGREVEENFRTEQDILFTLLFIFRFETQI